MGPKRQKPTRGLSRHRDERARLAAIAEEWRASALPDLSPTEAREVPLGVLPANDARTSRLPARRRRRLEEHLRELIGDIESDSSRRPVRAEASPSREDPDSTDALLGHACATCRGHCCRTAGDNAYLDTPTLRRFWSKRPKASGEKVVRAYLSALPERSYTGSCVFHASTGCTLPREMRAEICNVFLCDGARDLRNEIEKQKGRGAFLVAGKDDEILRVRVVDPEGAIHRRPAPPARGPRRA